MWSLSVCLVSTLVFGLPVFAQQQPGLPGTMGMSGGIVASNVPPQFKDVDFAQRLGQQLPLDTPFRDETGPDVTLGD